MPALLRLVPSRIFLRNISFTRTPLPRSDLLFLAGTRVRGSGCCCGLRVRCFTLGSSDRAADEVQRIVCPLFFTRAAWRCSNSNRDLDSLSNIFPQVDQAMFSGLGGPGNI